MLDIKQSTLSGYENGLRQPDFETLEKLANIFDISIDALFGRTKKDLYIISKENFKALLSARDAINNIERINFNNNQAFDQKTQINIGTVADNHGVIGSNIGPISSDKNSDSD